MAYPRWIRLPMYESVKGESGPEVVSCPPQPNPPKQLHAGSRTKKR